MTFGAPMVLYSQSPALLFQKLQALESWAERQSRCRHPPLQFHNYVNGADIVPRMLGSSLSAVSAGLASYVSYFQVSSCRRRRSIPFCMLTS